MAPDSSVKYSSTVEVVPSLLLSENTKSAHGKIFPAKQVANIKQVMNYLFIFLINQIV